MLENNDVHHKILEKLLYFDWCGLAQKVSLHGRFSSLEGSFLFAFQKYIIHDVES